MRVNYPLLFIQQFHIKNDMAMRKYNIPSISALAAFECVARLRGFGRAADELNTSQSAVSRHIWNLEIRIGIQLFNRDGLQISLTRSGEAFFSSVSIALEELQSAVSTASQGGREVTLVCTHEVSHLILMPRYSALREAMGRNTDLRILTTEYKLISSAVDTGAHIVFEYSHHPPLRGHVTVCKEQVIPVGTPEIIAQAKNALSGGSPPLLLRLKKENQSWIDWKDWQESCPATQTWREGETFDNYVYLLEAAVQGAGLALGWSGFVNRYLETGALVKLDGPWLNTGTALYARLTRFGQQSDTAKRCLKFLKEIA